jgi:hypothetical protein
MEKELAIHITAVPERLHAAHDLLKILPDAILHVDEEKLGPWKPSREVWKNNKADHCLLLQEDTLLVPNFLHHVRRVIDLFPDNILSFYRGWKGEIRGATFVGTNFRMNGPAICMPRDLAHEFVAWCDKYVKEDYQSYDTRIALFCKFTGRMQIFTDPSLVNHRQDVTSAMGKGPNRLRNRSATNWDPNLPKDFQWKPKIIPSIVPMKTLLTAECKALTQPIEESRIQRWHAANKKSRKGLY